jgi:hypothetical protein
MKTLKYFSKAFGISTLALLLAAPAYSNVASIPIVGTDGEGHEIDDQMPGTEYSKNLQVIVTTVNDSMTEALAIQKARASWKLTSILVGIGFGIEAGIGPIITAKAAPRFRLLFSKSDEPVAP